MLRKMSTVLVFAVMVVISYGAFQNPYSKDFVSSIKDSTLPVAKPADDALWQEIKEKASSYEKKAQNAKIDRVWKKIPGLNGLAVDEEASYQKMKKKGSFDPSLFQYKQITPDIQLKDLPAAPIYRGHPDKQMVSLNINVSWGEEYIPEMLNILKKHGVHATFFIEGKWANKHVDLVKMIQEQGHVIGNHAYNHPDMKTLTKGQIEQQITKTNTILESITNDKPVLFAPPSGSFSQQVVLAAEEAGMETILWSVDTVDWKKPAKEVLLERVLSKLHNGAFILMHPTASSSQALDDLILKIEAKKYRIGTVLTLLDEKREAIQEQ
ncbi:polysaccharide deacetylase family protein [Pontibacillus salicampi]|uniref:Polysaccharide deacetylase family protein n=1 Tax=Pontibacillus salicampi TaxID=1449801 RepID=A0ABV6LPL8_9BACI